MPMSFDESIALHGVPEPAFLYHRRWRRTPYRWRIRRRRPSVPNGVASRSSCQKQRVAAKTKTFAEFFAGIGLVGKALSGTGWVCTYANDIDPKKREIYDSNFETGHMYHEGDVWETDRVIERLRAPIFLATASFPCIDLSLAGNGRGFKGEHSSAFFGFTRVIESLGQRRPKLILVENVPGFLTSNDGDDFKAALKSLSGLGYWLDGFVLDAKSFVPQSRQRVFLVGVHESLDSPLLIKQGATENGSEAWLRSIGDTEAVRPARLIQIMREVKLETGWAATPIKAPPQTSYKLEAFLDRDDSQAWWDENDVDKHYSRLSDLHRGRLDEIIRSGTPFLGTGFRRKRYGSTRLEVRFDGIAGCLRTPRGGSAKQIIVMVDRGRLKMRWMSATEYARLQGVSQFKMLQNERQMLFGFGDGICVPVVEWIDQCVLTPLFEAAAAANRRGG